jgi:hypothetical protein
MNSLWDIRVFLGLVPKESPCITMHGPMNVKWFCSFSFNVYSFKQLTERQDYARDPTKHSQNLSKTERVQVVLESFYFIFSHIFTSSSLDQNILPSFLLSSTLCLSALRDNISWLQKIALNVTWVS